jgi:hypothetical protein
MSIRDATWAGFRPTELFLQHYHKNRLVETLKRITNPCDAALTGDHKVSCPSDELHMGTQNEYAVTLAYTEVLRLGHISPRFVPRERRQRSPGRAYSWYSGIHAAKIKVPAVLISTSNEYTQLHRKVPRRHRSDHVGR